MRSPPGPSLRDKHLCQQGGKPQWQHLKHCSYRQQEEEYDLIWSEKHSKNFVPKSEPAVTEIDFFCRNKYKTLKTAPEGFFYDENDMLCL